jgi:hypothetical protein
MKIEKLHVFAQLVGEPDRIYQIIIENENQNAILNFIGHIENPIRLHPNYTKIKELENENLKYSDSFYVILLKSDIYVI